MTGGRRILIAAGEDALRRALADELARQGWHAAEARDTAEVLAAAEAHDLVLIDAGLDGGTGLDLAAVLRETRPVVAMAGGPDAAARARLALEAGLGDCLVRPFRAGQLIARIEAALRDGQREAEVTLGPYQFRPGAKQLVDSGGRVVRLTEKEVAILDRLRRAFPRVLARDVLLAEIWGYGEGIDTHTLETHVYRLRRKLGADAGRHRLLLSVEGGYLLDLDGDAGRRAPGAT